MDKNLFWALIVIALIAGLSLGTVLEGSFTGLALFRNTVSGTETDNGITPEVFGVCSDSKGSYADSCKTSDIVTEKYYASNYKKCADIIYNCKLAGYSGCREGACYFASGTSQKQIGVYWPTGAALKCVDSLTDKGVKICNLYALYEMPDAQDCNVMCGSICTNFCGAKGLEATNVCIDTVETEGNACSCTCATQ